MEYCEIVATILYTFYSSVFSEPISPNRSTSMSTTLFETILFLLGVHINEYGSVHTILKIFSPSRFYYIAFLFFCVATYGRMEPILPLGTKFSRESIFANFFSNIARELVFTNWALLENSRELIIAN